MTTLISKGLYGLGVAIIMLTAYFGWPTEFVFVAVSLFVLGYWVEHKR